jgi:hypothetical protein
VAALRPNRNLVDSLRPEAIQVSPR